MQPYSTGIQRWLVFLVSAAVTAAVGCAAMTALAYWTRPQQALPLPLVPRPADWSKGAIPKVSLPLPVAEKPSPPPSVIADPPTAADHDFLEKVTEGLLKRVLESLP